jgi:FkbM family methyltransferase
VHGLLQKLRARLRELPLASYAYHRLRESLRPLAMADTPYGFRMAGHAAMQAGGFEPEEVALVRALLAERDLLVDVGANIGLYTCIARSLGKLALAVEPHPANQRILRANLAANGWQETEVAAMGLGAEKGEAELYGSDTGASLVSGWAGLPQRTLLRHRVRIGTLDGLLDGRHSGVRLLIKIDIEGAEHGLLRGAALTLERTPAPVWLVEICLTENFPNGVNPDYVATFDSFFTRGYRAFTANAARRPVSRTEVTRWAAQGRCDSGTHNYLFTR